MPTYDYRCNACGHELELFQSMSERTKRKCPDCGELKLERLIGLGGGVLFKGSGFYQTDYRSKSYSDGAEADQKSRDGKIDTKPSDAKSADTATKKSDEPNPSKKSDKATSKKRPPKGDD